MRHGDRILLSSIVWASGFAQLRVRTNGQRGELVPLAGLQLSYDAAQSQRRCIGHKPFRDPSTPWIDCDNAPLPQSRTCDRCAAVDATFASQLHHAHTMGGAEIDPAVRTHLDKPNVAYLAAFRDGSIKIGTSTAPRLETRLREQGAWVARIVAIATNGFAVRVLEDAASVELGLPQAVSFRRKLSGLTSPRDDASLDKELTSWVYGVHRVIGELGDGRITATDETWDNPLRGSGLWDHLHEYPHQLSQGTHDVRLLDACGRAVKLVRPASGDHFVADLAPLFGREITFAQDVVADEVTVQDSLF